MRSARSDASPRGWKQKLTSRIVRFQQAVAWALIIIGEASKALPSDLRERHEAVAWTKWAGLRNFLVHQYFRIDQRRIWRIIQRDIPPLEAAVTAELRRIVPNA